MANSSPPTLRPAVAGLLLVAGVVWLGVLARRVAESSAGPHGEAPSADAWSTLETVAVAGFFPVASFGGAVAAWLGHRRALRRGEADPGLEDPTGVYVGALLFGCVSLVGALAMLVAPEFMERYFA